MLLLLLRLVVRECFLSLVLLMLLLLRLLVRDNTTQGGTLSRQLIEQMTQPHSRIYSLLDGLGWMADVARGLDYLQRMSPLIIHRDM